MYNTSQAYIDMMTGRVLYDRISIVISNGSTTVTLTDEDIVKDSVSADWRASNNKTFSFGAVYATSFSFSALTSVETQIIGENLLVIPTLYFDVGEGQEQAIPLGRFFCSEPVVYLRTTSYECYDGMLSFDQPVQSRMTGLPYNCVDTICRKFGVTLGNSSLSFNLFANPTQLCVIDPEIVSTYRDALGFIAAINGAYCQMGRDGKLYLKQFHKTPDMSLARNRRISAAFSGFKAQFAGVKCRFDANSNYSPYEYVVSGRAGAIVDLGDIPIIEDTPENKNKILQNIYTNVLYDLEFYPCSIEMVGDPAIEAGDMITTLDSAGYSKNILLTSVSYRWRGNSEIVSEAGDPKKDSVATRYKRQEQREDAAAKAAEVVTTTYINAGQITVGSSEAEEITSLRFTTNKNLTAIFGAELPVYASGDGYVEITYLDTGIAGDSVKARVHEGYNLITLVNHIYFEANRIVLLQLKAQTEAIGSGTAPTVSFDANTIRSYIFAQGLETEAPWDGIITISEEVEYMQSILTMYGITDGVSVSVNSPIDNNLSDAVTMFAQSLNLLALSDTVEVSLEYGDQILRCGQGHRAGAGRMFAPITI